MNSPTIQEIGRRQLIWLMNFQTQSFEILFNSAMAMALGLPVQGELKQLKLLLGADFSQKIEAASFIHALELTGHSEVAFKYDKFGENRTFLIAAERTDDQRLAQLLGEAGLRQRSDPMGFIGILTDISEMVLKEAWLFKQLESSVVSLGLKDKFLSQISHELKTPLNGIAGMTQLLYTTEVDEEQKEYLHILRSASNRMNRLINNLVQYTQLINQDASFGRAQKVNLRELVRQILESQKSELADRGMSVEISLGASLEGTVWIDATSLEIAIDQLVDNAIKFGREGQVLINLYQDLSEDNQLVIEVVDEGYGFQMMDLNDLKPLHDNSHLSEKHSHSGLGLGLPILSRLKEMGCFDVHIESRRGVGTRATLRMAFKLDQENKAPEIDFKQLYEGKKALVVDDDENGRVILSMICKKVGMVCDLAANGFEAIEATKVKRYDIIYLDIQMPELNGMEVLKIIKERTENAYTPVVAVTAYALKGDEEHFLSTGFDGYIAKPVEISRFESTTQQMLQLKY